MANTYTLISSVTVGSGGAATIGFTSIPATYTDLLVKLSGRNTGAGDYFTVNFNSSSSNFSARQIFGNAATVYSFTQTTAAEAGMLNNSSTTASTFNNAEMYIPNYLSSNYKSFSLDSVTENNATTAYALLSAGLWSNTAAITSITLTPSANNFAQYSTAYLYGISNA